MTNGKKHIYILLLVIVLAAVSIYAIHPIDESTRLGLDLRGGLSVVLTAIDTEEAPVTEESLQQAEFIVRQRVDGLGVAEPQIQRQGARSILIQLPGVERAEDALDIIGKPAILQFSVVNPEYSALSVAELNELKDEGHEVLGPVLMTGGDLRDAQATYGGELGQPIVEMRFTSEGGRKFADITGQNVNERLAVVLDDEIMTAPAIRQAITGGSAIIEGIGSIGEAQDIALVLQTGALPVELRMDETRVVGPTLGMDSLRAGLVAGLIGLGLVAIFMVAYYRGFGFINCLALAVFAILFWGIVAFMSQQFFWTLTLPGIAGVIVSIGISADSSIIIFERIKEDIRGGKTFRTAAESGFWSAFRTVLDANFVTWLVAAVLFFIGIGPVRGFALMLALGMMVDLVTMLLFTRSTIGVLAHYSPKVGSKILGLRSAAKSAA